MRGNEQLDIIKEIITDQWIYRKQLFSLAKSDIMKTYRGATLGWAWALIKPTVTIFVFWFALAIGLRNGTDRGDCPYFLWLIAGIVPWFCMRDSIMAGASSIKKYKHLVTRIKYPVDTIPTFVIFAQVAIHVLLMFFVLAIFMLTDYGLDIHTIQIPFYMFFIVVFFSAWGIFAGMISAMSSDFKNLVVSLTTALFWLSGILYDVSGIKQVWIKKILSWNPITLIVDGYRNSLIYRTWFWENGTPIIHLLICCSVMIVLAAWAFKKLRKEIPDVL